MSIDEPPQWIKDYCDYLEAVFQTGFRVKIRMSPFEDREDRVGEVGIDWEYQIARLRFHTELKEDDEGYEDVTHEWLHIAGWALTQSQVQARQLVPKSQAQYIFDLLSAAEEQTWQRLSRVLTPLLRADFERKRGGGNVAAT